MSLTIAGLRGQHLARSALLIQVRYASSAPQKPNGTAQDVDRVLEEQRKQARMAPGMDPTRQGLVLFQPIVEPKFSLAACWDAGYRATSKYYWSRFTRWIGTKRSLSLIEKLDKSRGELTAVQRFIQWFPRLNNQRRAQGLLDDVFAQYIRFNDAQAKGNLALLRTTAQGNVLAAAEKRIRERQTGDKLDWQLLRVVQKPRLLNAISGQLTKEVYASQLVVSFDTEQSLTFKPKGRVAQVRSSRVKEHYVIQRLIPGFGPQWKLRDQIHETDPFAELKKEREAKRIEASNTKMIK